MIWDLHVHIGARPRANYSVSSLLAEMDDAGVDRACVFGFVEAIDNAYPAAAAAQHPDRLTAFCMVNPWEPSAAGEVSRLLSEGMRGIKLHPARQSFALNRQEIINPILDACAEHRAVFFAHGGSEPFNTPGKFAQIATDYPTVPIVVGHTGTPWGLTETLAVAREHHNVWLSTSLLPVNGIRQVLTEVGAHRLLLATDAPFNRFQDEIAKVHAGTSDPTATAAILGGNLQGMLTSPSVDHLATVGAAEGYQ